MKTVISLLDAAVARETARTQLESATTASERARSTATAAQSAVDRLAASERASIAHHAQRLERWTVEGGNGAPPALVPDLAHVQAKATAEATLRATLENVSRFTAAAATAQSELAAAEAQVRVAAKETARAEVHADFAELERLNRARAVLRERLLGAYLADPAALADREWLRVDSSGEFTAAAMQVGMPLIGVSIHEPNALGGDPRPARARVDAATDRYAARIAALCDTAAPVASVTEEVAA